MLKVDQYSYIRTAHRVYGKTIRQIARESGHSKNTIKRVLRGEYAGASESFVNKSEIKPEWLFIRCTLPIYRGSFF